MRKSRKSKILSLFLAIVMVVGMIPLSAITAFAAGENEPIITGATVGGVTYPEDSGMIGIRALRVGVPVSIQMNATGGTEPYTWESDKKWDLPDGLSIDPNTGIISGTPTAWSTGFYPINVIDAKGEYCSRSLTFIIYDESFIPNFTMSGALPVAVRNTTERPNHYYYSADITYSEVRYDSADIVLGVGAPAGLTAIKQGKYINLYGYIPNTVAPGTYTFPITVTNAFGSDTETFSIKVIDTPERPIIYSHDLPYALVGESYTTKLQGVGAGTLEWEVDEDDLPDWLTASADGTITTGAGLVPADAEEQNGIYVVLNSTDEYNHTTSDNGWLWIWVLSRPTITTDTVPNATVGSYYSTGFNHSCDWEREWTLVNGSLPQGLTLDNGGISGIPIESGEFTFTVRLTAKNSADALRESDLFVEKTFTMSVARPMSVTLSKTGSYAFTTLVSGYTAENLHPLTLSVRNTGSDTAVVSLALSGVGADKFTLSDTTLTIEKGHTEQFSVKPTVNIPAGTATATLTATVTNVSAHDLSMMTEAEKAKLSENITVSQTVAAEVTAPKFDSTSINSMNIGLCGVVGQPFSFQPELKEGSAPITWSWRNETWKKDSDKEYMLPPGLQIDPNTGRIYGTPTAAGNGDFCVKAENISGLGAKQEAECNYYNFYIYEPMTIAERSGSSYDTVTEITPAGYTFYDKYSYVGNTYFNTFRYDKNETHIIIGTGNREYANWSIVGGQLPPGISLTNATDSTGIDFEGTFEKAGDYTFVLRAEQTHSHEIVERPFTVHVYDKVKLVGDGNPYPYEKPYDQGGFILGKAITPIDLKQFYTGGKAPFTYYIYPLPEGLSISPEGILYGTPTAPKARVPYSSLRITDANGNYHFDYDMYMNLEVKPPVPELSHYSCSFVDNFELNATTDLAGAKIDYNFREGEVASSEDPGTRLNAPITVGEGMNVGDSVTYKFRTYYIYNYAGYYSDEVVVTFKKVAAPEAPTVNEETSGEVTFMGASTSVTLASATAGVKIYYTTDGTTPTDSSALYTAPFTLSGDSTTVKAIAKFGSSYSAVTTVNVVRITGFTVSGSVTAFGDTEADVTIQIKNAATSAIVATDTVTGNSGSYSFTAVAPGSYTLVVSKANHVTREYSITVSSSPVTQDVKICLKGDVNGDGKINSKDWNKIGKHIDEIESLTGYEFACGNVAEDNKINSKDWNKVGKHIDEIESLWS